MVVIDKSLQERARRVLSPSLCGGEFAFIANSSWPEGTPNFFSRAEGARLWDADGNEYLDFLGAFGPNLFGYGEPRVEAAAARQRALGNTMNGPAPVLVELAEAFVSIVSHADWMLFAKNGIDAVNAAVLIARAHTGKRRVLVTQDAYHGAAPWCTPVTVGVLSEQRAHRATCVFNDIDSLNSAVADAADDLAAILVPAYKHDGIADHELTTPEFARRCRECCDSTGALLIVDDIRAGLRLSRDCSWALAGVQPDLSCWSKAIANGYPISAVLGCERVREAGNHAFITGTFWLQAVPMAAALATLELVRNTRYLEHTIELGEMLRAGLDHAAASNGFTLNQSGPVQMPRILFANDPDFRFIGAFASAMLRRGVYIHAYHNAFVCAAMTTDDIAGAIEASRSAFAELYVRRESIQPNPVLARKLSAFYG
jgi:glutamate-1-semialdehyde 2,1-aminomutase